MKEEVTKEKNKLSLKKNQLFQSLLDNQFIRNVRLTPIALKMTLSKHSRKGIVRRRKSIPV